MTVLYFIPQRSTKNDGQLHHIHKAKIPKIEKEQIGVFSVLNIHSDAYDFVRGLGLKV